MANSPDDDENTSGGYQDWSHDLDSLQEIGKEALKKWRTENLQSPRDYPGVRWLADNGYSNIRWILREKHEMGTPEFFILITSAGGSDGYEWNINDVATIERANAYLDDRVECRGWSESTMRTQRSRINQSLGRFRDEYGDDGMIAIANDLKLETEVYEAFKQVIKNLRKELASDHSVHHYVRAVHRFFEWLGRSNRIAYDPMEDIEDEFRWDLSSDSTALTAEQVSQLWICAESDEDRMLVVGYCIWGVRTKELPRIHVNQIHLDGEVPYIEFEESDRKNGQGQVSLIFGLDTLTNLLEERTEQPSWDGYLFPSSKPDRSYLGPGQARQRFKNLCQKAGVKIDDDLATPKHGRTFYYNILADAETDLLEAAEKIAEEQGAKDARAVRDFYLTAEKRARYRRVFFRQRIRQILPEDARTEYSTQTDHDSSLDEFL